MKGIRDGEAQEVLADGRCVPRSRYLLRSVAQRNGLFELKLVPTPGNFV